MEKILRGSLILTFSNVTVRFIGYVYRILMGRMLSPYEFGLLNLALPLQYMAVILASSGIAPSIAKFVSQYRAAGELEKRDRTVYSSLVYFTGIGAVFGLFFYLSAAPIGLYVFHEPRVVDLIKISSLALPLGFAAASLTGAFQGFKKFDFMAITLVFQQLLRILLAVFLVFLGYEAFGAILGSTLGFLATMPLAFILLKRLNLGPFSHNIGEFKGVLLFSIPVSATSLAAFILAYVDILLIGYYLTPTDVGVYSAASPTSRLLLAFFSALYATLLPSISELKAKGDIGGIKSQVRKAYGLSILAVLPTTLLAIYFSESIIALLFPGEGYSAAAEPFKILVIGTAFLGIFTLNAGIHQGLGTPKTPMKILTMAAILDILLNIVLIPLYGIQGAAMASTMSFAFAGIISTISLKRYV
jgi:stage V sporulation protein B